MSSNVWIEVYPLRGEWHWRSTWLTQFVLDPPPPEYIHRWGGPFATHEACEEDALRALPGWRVKKIDGYYTV